MTPEDLFMIDERSAIEALRAGVPNRVAIRLLGKPQARICTDFEENLAGCAKCLNDNGQCIGQVIAGGYGTGKSHLLGYFQECALHKEFIVSWVTISKEAPLFDLGKLYLSAMRNATVPNRNDDAMTVVILSARLKREVFNKLVDWAESPESGVSPLIAALLYLISHPQTGLEQLHQIARFFAGGKLSLAIIRQWIREAGATMRFHISTIRQTELARQRLRVVPRMIVAAGYSGWVLLLDEVELIGRYSRMQRARSYAELARWLGVDPLDRVPGVVTVAAISEDFTSEVIRNRRDDEHGPRVLTEKNELEGADRARLGIDTLEHKQALLQTPTTELLQESLQKIRGFYSRAYNWDASAGGIGQVWTSKSMRQYIKSWITAWDHERLFGVRPEIEALKVTSDYAENQDIEQPPEHNGDESDEE